MRSQTFWGLCLASIIAAGILSRVLHTGFALFDKYLGDALYAAMVYTVLRLAWRTKAVVVPAAVLMTAIELFQLTMIPARMAGSNDPVTQMAARLLGTEFSFLDLAAYSVGIAGVYLMDTQHAERHPGCV